MKWGWTRAFIRCALLIAAGTALQFMFGNINPGWTAYPVSVVLALNYIYVLILLTGKSDEWKWVSQLTDHHASVSSLACMLGMTLVMGLTPQGRSLTSSWPFCLLMLYFITVLGMRAFKEVRNWRRYPIGAVIIHCAVFLAMSAAFFGSGDKVRARMIAEVGKPVHTALSAPEGRTVVLPFMVTLEEFVVEDSDEGVPQLFLSRVSLTDRKGRVRNVDIKVNHPARVGSWKIYQVGYDRKDLQKSTLECVRDGWYPIIRCSLWIILAAGIWMVFTSGHRKKKEESR